MNADDLRACATDIRKKASTYQASADAWYEEDFLAEIEDLCAEDADHIAAWHPAVALAVADWLDREAAICEALAPNFFPNSSGEAIEPTISTQEFVKAWRGES